MADNSDQSATRRRGPGRPFRPGQSGNPGGRPKDTDDVRQMAQRHTPEAITRLVAWMRSENPKASVTASLALIERGYGRPLQPMDITQRTKLDLTRLSDSELSALEQLMRKADPLEETMH